VQRKTPPVGGLTEEHRRAIAAVIPAGVAVTPEFWTELEEILVGFQRMHVRRARYDVKAERSRWQRLKEDVAALAPQLGEKLVLELERKIGAYAAYHDTWRAFSGTRNPHRTFLYWGVLRVWTDHLGGELRYSRATDGRTSGPLVRFFTACVEPILGVEWPKGGIADIVNRERKARAAPTGPLIRFFRRMHPRRLRGL
jgi:hypothetical protein